MAKFKYGNSQTGIVVDSRIDELVDAVYGKSGAVVADAMNESIERIYADALDWWPVKTGKSKKALNHYITITEDAILGGIGNTEDYVFYIKGKVQAGKSTWQELVRKPMRKDAKKIVDKTAEDIIALAEGRKR